ncbi:MAG: helix-turn-helix transcriptional regulator [Clostridiales bacterium]|nr:helix-turn-helix transcriptional regulator [Clostridiales bacterium]
MDYNKIGKFIATERKAKKLTQAKLAEKVFVSEKTVSKWENGKGLPDTNLLPKLCEVLGVGLNELLNGEKNITENKNQNTEQLLLNMAKELEMKNKTIWKSMWVIMTVSLIALLTALLLTAFLMPKGIWQLVSVLSLCIVFLIPCFYAFKLEINIGVYKCKNCSCEIIPSYTEALWAMHIGTTRYLKCPNCHKRTWCKKVIK